MMSMPRPIRMRWSGLRFALAVVGLMALAGDTAIQRVYAWQPDRVPQKLALLVGVNHYESRIFVDKPLAYAERDVEELARVLQGQGFRVITLTGAEATREAIEGGFQNILQQCKADDLIVLGFAGHGVQMPLVDHEGNRALAAGGEELADAYFCPVNAVFGRPESMVCLMRLVERLDREGGINLLLVDACRDNPDPNRSLRGRVRSLSGNGLVGRLPANSVILFSCSAGQRSLETPRAGGGHGVFFTTSSRVSRDRPPTR